MRSLLKNRGKHLVIVSCMVGTMLLSLFGFLPAASAHTHVPQLPQSALIPNDMYSMYSWGGLFGTRGGYVGVESKLAIPCIADNTPSGEAALWIGLGGMSGGQMIRAGVVLKNTWVNGSQVRTYSIFVQNLQNVVDNTPKCGDNLQIWVSAKGGITVRNDRTAITKVYPATPINPAGTVELVVEKPDGYSTPGYTLADFGKVTFADVAEFYLTPDNHMHMVDISTESQVVQKSYYFIDMYGNPLISNILSPYNDFTVDDIVRYPPPSYPGCIIPWSC